MGLKGIPALPVNGPGPLQYSFVKPVERGWYFCKNNEKEDSPDYWEVVVWVEADTEGNLYASWLTTHVTASCTPLDDASRLCQWAGPLAYPLPIEPNQQIKP